MDCLISWVGLLGAYDNPASGMFINYLPGITSEMISKIMSSDHAQTADTFDDVQRMAAKRMYADVVSQLSTRYQLKSIRESADIKFDKGVIPALTPVIPGTEYGLKIDITRPNRSFGVLSLSKVYFYSPEIFVGTIRIADAGKETIQSFPGISIVKGINEIVIDRLMFDDVIYILVGPAPGLAMYDTKLTTAHQSCFCQAVRKCLVSDCSAAISGVSIADGGEAVKENSTFGIGFAADLLCDYSSIVCRNKQLFTSAWMHLVGNQIMIELIASHRVNQPTTVDRDQYIELRDHFQLEYEKQLKTVIDGINLDDSCCVVCNPPVKRKTWVP